MFVILLYLRMPLLRLALALALKGLASLGGAQHRQVHNRHRRQPRGQELVARGHPQAHGFVDALSGGRCAMLIQVGGAH
jgi:hypothetical protein